MSKKFTIFCFTRMDDEEPVLHEKMQCMVYQREKAPTTGKLHWQGAFKVCNANGITVQSAIKLCLGHITGANGTWQQNVEYCTKEDTRVSDPVILGTPPRTPKVKPDTVSKLSLLVADLKNGSSLDELMINHTEAFIRNSNGIKSVIKAFSEKVTVPYALSDYDTPPLELDIPVVLVGSAGIGKTSFALAHFVNPLLVRHKDDLLKITKAHDGIVFDDMDFTHWPRTAQIHITDFDFPSSIDVKFGTAVIPARMKRIFTCNYYPFQMDASIERRVRVYDIDIVFNEQTKKKKKLE